MSDIIEMNTVVDYYIAGLRMCACEFCVYIDPKRADLAIRWTTLWIDAPEGEMNWEESARKIVENRQQMEASALFWPDKDNQQIRSARFDALTNTQRNAARAIAALINANKVWIGDPP